MEQRVTSLVFRRLTYADFRHINKTGGEEAGGGGQSYIDFPTQDIPLDTWSDFLGNVTGTGAQGRPQWVFPINSLGLRQAQSLKIYQRRSASVCIASQKIYSREANRVSAWHPDNGFPDDYDPATQNLVIYIIQTSNGEFWAGWFLENDIPKNWPINNDLRRLFAEEAAGYIQFRSRTFIDTDIRNWPFYFTANLKVNEEWTDEDIQQDLTEEDTSVKLKNMSSMPAQFILRVTKIRKRNKQLVKNLKELYKGKCQLTGEEFTFVKSDGTLYSEVHHLIPLGEEGSDSYSNAIVVSPMIHRMLHYANVSPINLADIKDNKLAIKINGKDYTITWHPDHIDAVNSAVA